MGFPSGDGGGSGGKEEVAPGGKKWFSRWFAVVGIPKAHVKHHSDAGLKKKSKKNKFMEKKKKKLTDWRSLEVLYYAFASLRLCNNFIKFPPKLSNFRRMLYKNW